MSDIDEKDLHPNKRNRLSVSCNVCRKRKVKCNRGKPCMACIKYNVAHLCKYQEPKWLKYMNDTDESLDSSITASTQVFALAPEPPQPMSTQQPLYSELELLKNRIRSLESSIAGQVGQVKLSPEQPLQPPVELQQAMMATQHQHPNQHPSIVHHHPHHKNTPSHHIYEYNANNYNNIYNNVNNANKKPDHVVNAKDMNANFAKDNYNAKRMPQPSPNIGLSPLPPTNIQLPPINLSPLLPPAEHPLPTSQPQNTNQLLNDLSSLRNNPVDSLESTINFFEGYSPIYMRGIRSMNHGPLSWITIMKKDPALDYLWKKVAVQRKEQRAREKLNSTKTASKPEEEAFEKRMYENEGLADLQPFSEKPAEKDDNSKNGTSNPLLNVSFYGKGEDYHEFIARLIKVLPKRRVIWILLDRFFVKLYPFLPFVDEKHFKDAMRTILGREDEPSETIRSLKVEKRLDFALIGTLMLILRLSYLTYFRNKTESMGGSCSKDEGKFPPTTQEQADIDYIKANPVDYAVVNAAQMCLNQFKLLRKSSFAILQCALYMRLYHIYAPEDGYGPDGGDVQVFTGMLIQMANSIGLNRDPDNFKHVIGDPRVANLWRKVWYQLLRFDMFQGVVMGNAFQIRNKSFDTKLPNYERGFTENVQNTYIEAMVIQRYYSLDEIRTKLSTILEMISDLRGSTKMYILSTHLNEIEGFLENRFTSLQQIMTPLEANDNNESIIKTTRLRNYLQLRLFVCTVNYYYFLYYEKKENFELCFFYIRKMLTFTCIETLPYLLKLIFDNSEILGPDNDLIVTPALEMAFHACIEVNVGMLVRLKGWIARLSESDQLYSTAHNMTNFFIKFCEKLLAKVSKLSNRYYYSWRMTRTLGFILNMIKTSDFIFPDDDVAKNLKPLETFCRFSPSQINELISIISNCTGCQKDKNDLLVATNIVSPTSDGTEPSPITSLGSEEIVLVDENVDNLWFNMLSNKTDQFFVSNANNRDPSQDTGFNNLNYFGENFDGFDDLFRDEPLDLDLSLSTLGY